MRQSLDPREPHIKGRCLRTRLSSNPAILKRAKRLIKCNVLIVADPAGVAIGLYTRRTLHRRGETADLFDAIAVRAMRENWISVAVHIDVILTVRKVARISVTAVIRCQEAAPEIRSH